MINRWNRLISLVILAGSLMAGCGAIDLISNQDPGNQSEAQGEPTPGVEPTEDGFNFTFALPPDFESEAATELDIERPDDNYPMQSERIEIVCWDEGDDEDSEDGSDDGDSEIDSNSAAELSSLADQQGLFIFRLEEIRGNAHSAETIAFAFDCRGYAVARVHDLRKGSEYRLSAELLTMSGSSTHQGETKWFSLHTQGVELVMTRLAGSGSKDIDIIFTDDNDDQVCHQKLWACAEIYAPVFCVVHIGGIGEPFYIEAENECSAKVQAEDLACTYGTTKYDMECGPMDWDTPWDEEDYENEDEGDKEAPEPEPAPGQTPG